MTTVRRSESNTTQQVLYWLSRFSPHIALMTFSLLCFVPMLLIVSASFTQENSLTLQGYSFIPTEFSLDAYQLVFDQPNQLLRSYGITLFVTVFGTATGMVFMAMIAYALSRHDFLPRRWMSLFVFLTLLFNGGLVPYYILVTQYLELQDTIWILLLPRLVNVFYILILRTYFAGLPKELLEAARVDGASEWRIFWQIAVPLAKPALATIALFTALDYWNDWTTPLYFIRDPDLFPLQHLLQTLMRNAAAAAFEPSLDGTPLPLQTTRMAMAVLATGPAALFFLFFQKYLIQGITLGSAK